MLEIGNTFYVPALRGTGLNRRVKDLMIGRAIDCGFRRIEFLADESFDEGSHIDRLLRDPKVARDLGGDEQ